MSAYLAALLIIAASLLVGAALTSRGALSPWTAPSAGLAALMLVSLVTIRLPGHGETAAVATGLAVLAAAGVLVVRGGSPGGLTAGLPVVILVLAVCSLPFIANERVGILGVTVSDDLAFHMRQADAMRTQGAAANVTADGYPTGPHAVVAAMSEAATIDIASAFTGLLIATPVLIALTSLAVLGGAGRQVRTLAAVLVGTAYLPASYLTQGAFKEPLLALFLLGFVLTLRDGRRSAKFDVSLVASLVLTAAAGVAVFGVAALAWCAAVPLWLAALEMGRGRVARLLRWRPRPALMIGALAALAVAAAGIAAGTEEFFRSGPGRYLTDSGVGGNYVGQLSPFEVLGGWPEADFRYSPAVDPPLLIAVLVAMAVVGHGLVWCWRRQEWALLAGALGALSVYVVARPITLAYFSGKALVVAAPLLVLVAVKALTAVAAAAEPRTGLQRVALAGLIAYAGVCLYSSAIALRNAQVRPSERGEDLERFNSIAAGHRTLYFGRDNYVTWDLREAHLWGYQHYSKAPARRLEPRAGKTAGDADPPAVDVDSIDYRALDGFRYLVIPRTPYASLPPPNFRLIGRTRWHLLWQRQGPTLQRKTLNEGEAPGALFDCTERRVRQLRTRPGKAMVRARPVLGPVAAWKDAQGGPLEAPGKATEGQSMAQRLRLPAGRWDVSIRYLSAVPLGVRAGRLERQMPAYLAERSSFVSVGTVRTEGEPLTVEVTVPERSRLSPQRTALVGSVVATRVDRQPRLVPLRAACGRYVDWIAPGVLR